MAPTTPNATSEHVASCRRLGASPTIRRRPDGRPKGVAIEARPRVISLRPVEGFTLIELVVVLIIAGIIAAVVGAKWNARSATAPFQAELLARNIRHAQMLAMTWNTPVGMRVPSATQYDFLCTNALPPAPCLAPSPPTPPNNPVTDPVLGAPFRTDLEYGVTITSLGGPPPRFDNLGIPLNATTGLRITTQHVVQLDAGGTTWSVSIQPLTGFVQVGSP